MSAKQWLLGWMMVLGFNASADGLKPGDAIEITLRGVPVEEQQRISGEYSVGDDGRVRLPLLEDLQPAAGMTAAGFARSVEKAYKAGGIYATPAIHVVAKDDKKPEGAVISLGGQVRRAGQVPYRQDMTVIQALDAAGGRNEFGGRNLLLFRDGKQVCLDFKQLAHKNIRLEAGDSIQVEQRAALIDSWKGNEAAVRPYLVR